jgi:hypothetical protein
MLQNQGTAGRGFVRGDSRKDSEGPHKQLGHFDQWGYARGPLVNFLEGGKEAGNVTLPSTRRFDWSQNINNKRNCRTQDTCPSRNR